MSMSARTLLDRLPLVRVARALSVVTVTPPEPEDFRAGADYAASPAVQMPYSSDWAMSALRANVWLATAVRVIAQTAAMLPLVVEEEDADGEWSAVDSGHAACGLLKQPEQALTQRQWREQLVTDLVPSGNAFLLAAGQGDGGLPESLLLLETHRCKWIPGPNGRPKALEYDQQGKQARYDPADVVHIRTASHSRDLGRLYGTGVVQALDASLRADTALAVQMAKKAQQGKPLAAYVPRDASEPWGPGKRDQMQTQLDAVLRAKAGGIPVLSGAGKFESMDWSIDDMGGTTLREWTRAEVSAATGVPPTLLSLQSANYATSQTEYRWFLENTLASWAGLVDDVLTDFLHRRGYPRLRVRHVLPEAQETSTTRMANAQSAYFMGADPVAALQAFGFDGLADAFPEPAANPAESEEAAEAEAQAEALADALTDDQADGEENDADVRAGAQSLIDSVGALLAVLRGAE